MCGEVLPALEQNRHVGKITRTPRHMWPVGRDCGRRGSSWDEVRSRLGSRIVYKLTSGGSSWDKLSSAGAPAASSAPAGSPGTAASAAATIGRGSSAGATATAAAPTSSAATGSSSNGGLASSSAATGSGAAATAAAWGLWRLLGHLFRPRTQSSSQIQSS